MFTFLTFLYISFGTYYLDTPCCWLGNYVICVLFNYNYRSYSFIHLFDELYSCIFMESNVIIMSFFCCCCSNFSFREIEFLHSVGNVSFFRMIVTTTKLLSFHRFERNDFMFCWNIRFSGDESKTRLTALRRKFIQWQMHLLRYKRLQTVDLITIPTCLG